MHRPLSVEPHPFLPPRTPGPTRHIALATVLAGCTLGCLALLVPALAAGRDALVTDVILARLTPWAIPAILALLLGLACAWTDRGVPMRGDDEGAASDDADRG